MLRMMLALILSAAIVLLTGPKLIAWLRKLKLGQTMYELGPQSHMKKQGTPIMGGLCIALGCVVAFIVCGATLGAWDHMLALLFVALGSMAVGLGDDWIKMVKKRHEGLTPWQKIIGQAVVCLGFACYCYFHPEVGSKVIIPFFNVEWDLGIFYIPLLALTVLFMVNSANLQDGLDGILSSVTAVGSIGWAAIAMIMLATHPAMKLALDSVNPHALQADFNTIAVFALALCGACIGFLRFNHYPATVFMGDTGSMFIGGAVVGMAMLMRQPFLLLLIAFTCVMSSVSVILQRYYYKLTRKLTGTPKRLFKMSPLHHHFELSGWSENKLVTVFSAITFVCSALAFWGILGRY